ncbi:MAG: hypothetical protein WA021_04250 [Minisyncoccia bacterium]
MAKTMTPSLMTDGQIEKIVDKFRAGMRKNRSGISSDVAQQIVSVVDNLGRELCEVVLDHAKRLKDYKIHRVKVDRSRPPQEVLNATGRILRIDPLAVESMPRGEGSETEIVFFKVHASNSCWISHDDLEKEYRLRGLKPVDAYSLADFNKANPAFADGCCNYTHWKKGGQWHSIAFHRWAGGRAVDVHSYSSSVNPHCYFAGMRK